MRKPVSSRWRTFAATTCAAMCATTGACASAAFAVQAGRAEAGGGEQIGHGLADPVLGDQLLDVEIDRGRSQARTVLHARRHRVRERRLRHAAAMVAAVDQGAVFGDLQAWLRQIEHLAALLVRHHRVRQAGLAVSTGRGRMALDAVGLVHRAEGIALVAGLAAARLAQPAALAFEPARRLFQTLAGWGLGAVGAGLVQPALQFGHKLLEGSIFLAESRVFRPQGIDITSQRADQVCQGWGLVHPCLESWQRRARQQNRRGMRKCRPAVAFETHRGTTTRGWLGVTFSVGVCFDQIYNQAAKFRYMFGGKARTPLVIRTMVGAGRSAAAQHSQSPYGIFTSVPGLKVVIPSNAYDAKGLLIQAIRDDDPVIFCEHKLMYDLKTEVPDEAYTIPFGEANIVRDGDDVTVVALARMVHYAAEAADGLASEDGIECELIDPRTTSPLDEDTILESVERTGRLVIVDEATPRCSFATDVAALVADRAFDALKAPIRRVTAPHTPVPFTPSLEKLYIPSPEKIAAAIREVHGYAK